MNIFVYSFVQEKLHSLHTDVDLGGDMQNSTCHPHRGHIMSVDILDTQFYTLWSAEVTKYTAQYCVFYGIGVDIWIS